MDSSQEDVDKYGADVVTTVVVLIKYPEKIKNTLQELLISNKDLYGKVYPLLIALGIISHSVKSPAQEHLDKGEQFFRSARFEEAIKEYKLAIDANPQFADAYMYLGDRYYRMGQYHLAIPYFEESISLHPSQFAYRFLGDAYRNVGKYNEAIETYRKALKIDPNYEVSPPRYKIFDNVWNLSASDLMDEISKSTKDKTQRISDKLGNIPDTPIKHKADETNAFNITTFSMDMNKSTEYSPQRTDELIKKIGAEMPILLDILSIDSLEEQIYY